MSLFEQASLIVTPNAFKASKLYAIKPTSGAGDLDVVRATTATRVNSAGLIESVANNVPRLDYTNGSCPSILVEPQRTNYCLYSEEFNNGNWNKVNLTVTPNDTIDPTGNSNADKINTTSPVSVLFIGTSSSTTTATASIFVKKSTQKYFGFTINGTNDFDSRYQGVFDLDLGTIFQENNSTNELTNTSSKIESYANGWYRVIVTATFSTSADAFISIQHSNNIPNIAAENLTWDNSTNGSSYVWGAQLEAGSYATSYIPTVASTVTRNADVISKTGISSLIGQTEGTLFVDFNFKQGIESFIIGSGNGSYFNNLAIECYSNKAYLTIFNNSASLQGTIETTTLTTGKHKLAVAYNSTQVIAYLDGVSVGTLGAITFPSFNNLYLGNLGSDTNPKNININTSVVWKTRLTNSELATLTTL